MKSLLFLDVVARLCTYAPLLAAAYIDQHNYTIELYLALKCTKVIDNGAKCALSNIETHS